MAMNMEIFGAAISVMCGVAVLIWLIVTVLVIEAVVRRVRA
jgi:hypothetical protein